MEKISKSDSRVYVLNFALTHSLPESHSRVFVLNVAHSPRKHIHTNSKVDVFMTGVTLAYLLCKDYPFAVNPHENGPRALHHTSNIAVV